MERGWMAGLAVGTTVALCLFLAARGPGGTESDAGGWTGHVHDEADLLGPWEKHLERLAEGWEQDLGIDVRVVTRPAGGQRVESLADEVFHELRVGGHAPTGGLLILVDPEGSRARIEVSYSLEGAFPDAVVSRIARDQLAPYASYSALGMAVMDVLHFLKDTAFEQVAAGALSVAPRFRERKETRERLAYLSGGAGAQVRIPEIPADRDLKQRVPPEERGRYAPSSKPRESVEAFLRVLEDLVGDPELALFTPGSREQRRRYPVAPYEYLRRRDTYERSGQFTVLVEGNRAVVRSSRPVPGTFPVFLHQMDGRWRVDTVELWKNVFFDGRGEPFVGNRNNPYRFGLDGIPGDREVDLGPLDLNGREPGVVLAELEADLVREPDAQTHLRVAEILLRNCFVLVDALVHYEAAARLAPKDQSVAETVANRALHFGFYEFAIPYLERLGPAGYERLGFAHRGARNFEQAEHYYRLASHHH
jgi:hypothetical protein